MLFKSFFVDHLLLEDKVEYIISKQGPKVIDAYHRDHGQGKPEDLKDAGEVLDHLAKACGTLSEKFLQWITNRYIAGDFSLEDEGRIGDVLKTYEKAKPKLEKKDLNAYKSLDELERALATLSPEDLKSNREAERELEAKFFTDKDAELFYEGGGIKVIIPKTEEASCYFGVGTKWCTAGKNRNAFKSYHANGPLYILFTADGRKYQLYFPKNGFAQTTDEEDHSIKNWHELVKKYPVLYDAFETEAKKASFFPLMREVSDKDLEAAFKKDPDKAITYANSMNRVLPDSVTPMILKKKLTYKIARHPRAFSVAAGLDLLKSDPSSAISWLTGMAGEINRTTFDGVLNILLDTSRGYYIDNVIKYCVASNSDDHEDAAARKIYKPWVMDQPLEMKKQLIKKDRDLIEVFEDDLPEAYKIEMIQHDPDILEKFKKPSNKMKDHARWTQDKLKRQRRGF